MNFQNTYKRVSFADTFGGTCLRMPVGFVTTEKMTERFGRADDNCEWDKGYENEWVFDDANSETFTVYDRYGQYRIGARHNAADQDVDRFVNWLKSELEQVKVCPMCKSDAGNAIADDGLERCVNCGCH